MCVDAMLVALETRCWLMWLSGRDGSAFHRPKLLLSLEAVAEGSLPTTFAGLSKDEASENLGVTAEYIDIKLVHYGVKMGNDGGGGGYGGGYGAYGGITVTEGPTQGAPVVCYGGYAGGGSGEYGSGFGFGGPMMYGGVGGAYGGGNYYSKFSRRTLFIYSY
ncbi:hypothetical protein OROHE_026301 [Orobanche hederae]